MFRDKLEGKAVTDSRACVTFHSVDRVHDFGSALVSLDDRGEKDSRLHDGRVAQLEFIHWSNADRRE
jgi:hypothetical protein